MAYITPRKNEERKKVTKKERTDRRYCSDIHHYGGLCIYNLRVKG